VRLSPGAQHGLNPRSVECYSTPIRLISQCRSIPEFSFTRAHRLAERFDIVTGRIAGIDQEIAVHFRDLRSADAKAAHARGIDQFPGAVTRRILNVEPPVFSRIGCAVSRWFCTSSIRARMVSGSVIVPRYSAEVKITDISTPDCDRRISSRHWR
jgi:hypothetical protein